MSLKKSKIDLQGEELACKILQDRQTYIWIQRRQFQYCLQISLKCLLRKHRDEMHAIQSSVINQLSGHLVKHEHILSQFHFFSRSRMLLLSFSLQGILSQTIDIQRKVLVGSNKSTQKLLVLWKCKINISWDSVSLTTINLGILIW